MSDLALGYHGADAVSAPKRPATTLPTLSHLVARIIASVSNARRRRDEAEVAQLIRQNGGVFSDELERRIARRLGA